MIQFVKIKIRGSIVQNMNNLECKYAIHSFYNQGIKQDFLAKPGCHFHQKKIL